MPRGRYVADAAVMRARTAVKMPGVQEELTMVNGIVQRNGSWIKVGMEPIGAEIFGTHTLKRVANL